MSFDRGVRLGVDVGQVRVGVAISDPDGILATPLVTLARDLKAPDGVIPADIAEIARLVRIHEGVGVVVGLPVRLTGDEGPAAVGARAYAQRVAAAIDPVPTWLSDERDRKSVV